MNNEEETQVVLPTGPTTPATISPQANEHAIFAALKVCEAATELVASWLDVNPDEEPTHNQFQRTIIARHDLTLAVHEWGSVK